MSHKHHNYTDYTKPQQAAPVEAPVVEEVVEETVVTPDAPVVEEVAGETVVTPETPTEPEPVYGVVSECAKLRVRKEPSTDAAVICELPLATEVLVDEANSTEEFYKVVTGAGVEGYCMKKFIELD